MALIIYSLCSWTSFICLWMLLKSYFLTKSKILLWSSLCFSGLFINNILLIIDGFTGPKINLLTLRSTISLISFMFLLFGLIWEEEPI